MVLEVDDFEADALGLKADFEGFAELFPEDIFVLPRLLLVALGLDLTTSLELSATRRRDFDEPFAEPLFEDSFFAAIGFVFPLAAPFEPAAADFFGAAPDLVDPLAVVGPLRTELPFLALADLIALARAITRSSLSMEL